MKLKIFLGGIFCIALLFIYFFVRPYYLFLTKTLQISPLKTIISPSVKKTNDTVNILILGKAGGNHDGPNLTDSINVASINIKTKKIVLFSLPRDIWSEPLEEKINAAYAIGEAKEPHKGGLILAKAEVGAVLGQPIHYGIVIDFERFKELIDFFGGIDIKVEHTFTDTEFPITGKENDLCNGDPKYKCRYETLHFEKGTQHMNGNTALKYVRSRHATGEEGSDFARGKRQQKMIQAIIQEMVSLVKSNDVEKIKKTYEVLNTIIERDVNNENLASLLRYLVSSKKLTFVQKPLSQDFFIVPNVSEYGRYVIIPSDGNYDEIHSYVRCVLETNNTCEKR